MVLCFANAEDIAKQFAKTIKDLPDVDSINVTDHGNTISNLYSLYNSIGDYEKKFLDEEDVKKMNSYVAKLNTLLAQLAEDAAKEKAEKESSETSDSSQDSQASDTENAEKRSISGSSRKLRQI